MNQLKLTPAHHISLYQSILELPANRHVEYACHLAYANGIGSSLEAVEEHKQRAEHYRTLGEKYAWAATEEEVHALYCENFLAEGYIPDHYAFATLVASVDGVAVTDYSEQGLRTLLQQLKSYGLTAEQMEQQLQRVAEVLQAEYAKHFPEIGQQKESEDIYLFQQKRRRLLAVCDYLLNEDPQYLKTVQQVDEALLDMNPPGVFDDGHEQNVVMLRRRAFTQLCVVLNEHGVPQPEKLSVYDFYGRLHYVQEKMKASAPTT